MANRMGRTCVLAGVLGLAGSAGASVFNMGPGQTNLQFVPVGNAGNVGRASGASAGPGGYGEDRACGAVGYNYNIAKFEVTAAQYTEFLNAVAATDTHALYNPSMATGTGCRIIRSGDEGSYSYSTAGFDNVPVNFVSITDTLRFANWLTNGQPTGAQDASTTESGSYDLSASTLAGKLARQAAGRYFLTSEDEWYKAAYYDPQTENYFDYPTSSNAAPGTSLDPGAPNNANYVGAVAWPYYSDVGAFAASPSPHGTFDQGGNVAEWTESLIWGGWGNVRGGMDVYGVERLHANYRMGSDNWSLDTGYEDYYIGFRISEIPEPSAASLLLIGGAALIRQRRPRSI